MEDYKKVLEYLIELKKTKKEPNRIDKDQFAEAWNSLVAAEGFSEEAEAYLYNGFTYCGAHEIKRYIKQSENPVETLRRVFGGKMYGKNCANTVPILFHLLTLLLNDRKSDILLISELFKRIPSALKNKEKKIYGQADRALKKYVLDELHTEELPSLQALVDSGLSPIFIEKMADSFDKICADMKSDGFSKKCLRNIEQIKVWLHPEKTAEKTAQGIPVTEGVNESKENVIAGEKQEGEQTGDKNEVLSPEEKSERKQETVTRQQKENSEELEKQYRLVVTLKQQLSEATTEKARLSELVTSRDSRINVLTRELDLAKRDAEELGQRIDQLEKEQQERMKMMEALSRDRAKQSDEAMNRLASKLRIEYRDFMDAIDNPMNSDLGENMREQLKNIFDILIKSGISIS